MSKGCRVFVGNLPQGVERKEIETLFHRYGRVISVDLKDQRGGPSFAFVEFEDARDAEDAVSERDGSSFQNCNLRVEFPRGESRGRGGRDSGGRFPGDGIGRPSGARLSNPVRRSVHRVLVSGLPLSVSWQDLKDHMRDAGEVCFAEVFRDGSGMVEFRHREGLLDAVERMNDTKIRSHQGDSSFIRVKEENADGGGSGGYRGRSRLSRSRSRSRSYSPPGRRGRSPSRSPYRGRRGRSRSDSRSRSRSRSNPRSFDERY